MAYKKLMETKIIRVEHEVTFRVGISARGLKIQLKNVPDDCELTSVFEGDEEKEASLTFLQEAKGK